MDEKEMQRAVSEIREWLVEINSNQKHQTEILTEFKEMSQNAFRKADAAQEKADRALLMAANNERDFDRHVKEEKVRRRWFVGVVTSVLIALLPILSNVYL